MTQDSPHDPHAELHEHAAQDTQHDEPVQAGDGEDWKTALDKVNKALTKRINDLRTDNDKFKTSTSNSVQTLTGEVNSAKTAIQNNKDSIEAQDSLIEEAKTAATSAAKKADAASSKADGAKTAADAATQKATKVETDLASLTTRYEQHAHNVTIAFDGHTGPPSDNGEAQ